MSCDHDPDLPKHWIKCLDYILPSPTDLFDTSLALTSICNPSNQILSHLFSKKICHDHNDFMKYWPISNLRFIAKIMEKHVLSKVFSISTYSKSKIHFNHHIVLDTALKPLFWKMLMIRSNLLTMAICLYLPCLAFIQLLTHTNIQSLYTITMMILRLPMLFFNVIHVIWLTLHSTSLCLIIVLLFLLCTQVFLRNQLLAPLFSQCI